MYQNGPSSSPEIEEINRNVSLDFLMIESISNFQLWKLKCLVISSTTIIFPVRKDFKLSKAFISRLSDYKTAINASPNVILISPWAGCKRCEEKRDFNLNWSINLHCQCARLTVEIVWWCTVHYKDNWHFNVQSIITATYVFNFPPNWRRTWAMLNLYLKLLFARFLLATERKTQFREKLMISSSS